MPTTPTFDGMQVHGWEPARGVEDTDVGMTLGELPAGFCIERHSGDESMSPTMMVLRRLAPPSIGSSTNAFAHITHTIYEASHPPSAFLEPGSGPFATLEPPMPAIQLPTPPQTRSSSLVSSPTSTHIGPGTRPAMSSRSPAAAGVPRRIRTSTERKFERKRAENANYIPRPKNSFILFRTDFVAKHKKVGEASGSTASAAAAATTAALLAAERRVKEEGYDFDGADGEELEGASLSKQASEVWNRMNDEEKQPWVDLAEKEKAEHARRYPNYRYRPVRSNSATTVPSGFPITTSAQRAHKSVSPGARSAGHSSSPALNRSTSLQEEPKMLSEEDAIRTREKEETQKRRCELIHELMTQGYRGGELTTALLMLEGGVLPPGPPLPACTQDGGSLPLPSLPAAPSQASIPSEIDPSTASSSEISSVSQPLARSEPSMALPTSAVALHRGPMTIIPLVKNANPIPMRSSSSSLARALIPKTPSPPALPKVPSIPSLQRSSTTSGALVGPIPRSPSAPVFDTRSIEHDETVKNASPTTVSCPSTPHTHLRAMDVDDGNGGSPFSYSSTLTTHSVPPSPDDKRKYFMPQAQLQPAGPVSKSTDSTQDSVAFENEYVPMNEFYEHYDSNTPFILLPLSEQVEASVPTASASTASAPQHEQQRPLEAVAAIWSRSQSNIVSSSETVPCAAPNPVQASTVWVPRQSATPSSQTSIATSFYSPATIESHSILNEEQMCTLTGPPSPSTGPRDTEKKQMLVVHPTPSLGDAANQRTDVDIEAYQLGLDHTLRSSSSSSAHEFEYPFMFSDADTAGSYFEPFDLDFGTAVLPASTVSYSALGLYNGDPDNSDFDGLLDRAEYRP